MKTAIAAFVAFTALSGASAQAASLCNCCGDGTEASCATVCSAVTPAVGQCVATIDPAGQTVISADQNPLYDIPLRNAWLDSSDRKVVESFRRLLESARKGAEADRKLALRARRSGKIDDATAISKAKRYDDAIVNYYLGVQAYKVARSAKN
jgi:hypothetical protein